MPDYKKIIAFFDEYIRHYKAFLQFEYLKMDMINHNQIEKLSDSLSTEQALIMKTNSLENKRAKLLEGLEGKSFAEIAENEGITRQGAHDQIKRAEAKLLEWEEKCRYCEKILKLKELSQNDENFTEIKKIINDL